MPRASLRRIPFALFSATSLVAVFTGACGGPPPAAPKPAAPKPVAIATVAPPPDLSAVPRPDAMVVFARLAKPEAALKTVGGWTQLPMPGADVLSELVTGAPVGQILDLSQPIDIAISMGGDARSPDPQVAVSAAVKSLEDVRGALGDKYKLTPGANGVLMVDGLGDGDHVCEISPSAGQAPLRIVCADSGAGMESLGPWLTRSAPRDSFGPDLHVEMRMAPVRPIVKSFRGMLPMLLARALDARGGAPSVTQAIDAAVGDLSDLSNDLDGLNVDLSLSDPGADASITASFNGMTAVISRIALAYPEHADAPPQAFWHLPADSDVAYFTRGVDAKEITHARDLTEGVLLAALEKQNLPEADRKALVGATLRYLDLHTGAIVYAKGLDMTRVDKARGDLDHAKDDARKNAEEAFMAALGGWSVVQTTEPIAKTSQIARDLAAALARPGLVKWAKTELHGAPAPSARISALPKTAQLPADSFHMEIEVHDDPSLGMMAPKPLGGGAATFAKGSPAKPRAVHVLIVPDAGKSWIVLAGDLDLAIAKARAVLPGAADTGTLASRAELAGLKTSRSISGGFVSARGILAPSPFRFVIGGTKVPRGPLFDGLANTQAQGTTPVVFMTNAEAKGVGGSFVLAAKVPRAAVDDIVKIAIKHL